jgi:hypothetical protein
MKTFIYFQETDGGMTEIPMTIADDLKSLYGWMSQGCKEKDTRLLKWFESAEIGDYMTHRMGTIVRVKPPIPAASADKAQQMASDLAQEKPPVAISCHNTSADQDPKKFALVYGVAQEKPRGRMKWYWRNKRLGIISYKRMEKKAPADSGKSVDAAKEGKV